MTKYSNSIVACVLTSILLAEPSAAVVRSAFCVARPCDALRTTHCALPVSSFARQALALVPTTIPKSGPGSVNLAQQTADEVGLSIKSESPDQPRIFYQPPLLELF